MHSCNKCNGSPLKPLILLYEQSGSVRKDPHGLLQKKRMPERDIMKQYVQRTKRMGMNLNDFATKLTVTSRSQRNYITNNHLLKTKMTLDAPGKL